MCSMCTYVEIAVNSRQNYWKLCSWGHGRDWSWYIFIYRSEARGGWSAATHLDAADILNAKTLLSQSQRRTGPDWNSYSWETVSIVFCVHILSTITYTYMKHHLHVLVSLYWRNFVKALWFLMPAIFVCRGWLKLSCYFCVVDRVPRLYLVRVVPPVLLASRLFRVAQFLQCLPPVSSVRRKARIGLPIPKAWSLYLVFKDQMCWEEVNRSSNKVSSPVTC